MDDKVANDKAAKLLDKITLNILPNSMEVIKKWSGVEGVFMVLIAMFAAYYIHHQYDDILLASNIERNTLTFLLISVGFALSYYLLAQLLNCTMIKLDGKLLVVKHGPVPWRGNIIWPVADLQKVYVKMEIEEDDKQDYDDEEQFQHDDKTTNTSIQYGIHAVTISGENIKLLSCDENPKEAMYLEEKIDGYLQNIKKI